jgi:hypothetical protein
MEDKAMVKLAVMISVFALVACGGSDTPQTGDAGGAPPVDAAAEKAPVVPAMPKPAAPEPAVSEAPEVKSCLDLIRQSEFQQALPVCVAALDIDPDNQQVKDAVALAGTESAKSLAAEKAAGAVAGGTAEEATSKLGGAAGGMADKLGQ